MTTDLHQQLIAEECDAVKSLLLQKNADYGSPFANPIGIFAKALTAEQQIGVRIDDKLQRILTGRNEISEDTEQDLIGYLVLRRVLRRIGSGEADGGVVVDTRTQRRRILEAHLDTCEHCDATLLPSDAPILCRDCVPICSDDCDHRWPRPRGAA